MTQHRGWRRRILAQSRIRSRLLIDTLGVIASLITLAGPFLGFLPWFWWRPLVLWSIALLLVRISCPAVALRTILFGRIHVFVRKAGYIIACGLIACGLIFIGIFLFYKDAMLKPIDGSLRTSLVFRPGKDFASATIFPEHNSLRPYQFRLAPEGGLRFMRDNAVMTELKGVDASSIDGIAFDFEDDTRYIDAASFSEFSIAYQCDEWGNDSASWPFRARLVHAPHHRSRPEEEKEIVWADSEIGYFEKSNGEWNTVEFYLDDFRVYTRKTEATEEDRTKVQKITGVRLMLTEFNGEAYPSNLLIREFRFK